MIASSWSCFKWVFLRSDEQPSATAGATALNGGQEEGALVGLQGSIQLDQLDPKTAEREAAMSANIKVGYRAPRGVKPHGWYD